MVFKKNQRKKEGNKCESPRSLKNLRFKSLILGIRNPFLDIFTIYDIIFPLRLFEHPLEEQKRY